MTAINSSSATAIKQTRRYNSEHLLGYFTNSMMQYIILQMAFLYIYQITYKMVQQNEN